MNSSPDALFQQGIAAVERGDFSRADAIARDLCARDPNDIYGLQITGFSAYRQGDAQTALKAFWQANRAVPGQPSLLFWLGVLYKERADLAQAERAFRDTVRLRPANADAWCHLAETVFLAKRREEARSMFEKALELEPNSASIVVRTARFFEISHELEKARALAQQALTLDPDNDAARLLIIEIDFREKRFDDVLSRIASLSELRRDVSESIQARLCHLSASAHDRLGNHAAAFDLYSEANRLQARLSHGSALKEQSPLQIENINRVSTWLKTTDIAAWNPEGGLVGQAPVFLLGFVRSGTTLLDQMLSSHPSVTVMEEEDLLADAWRELTLSDVGLSRLAAMSKGEINKKRESYWSRAAKIPGGDAKRPIVVDKLPLNTVNLPLIWRIFPESKIIFAVRDPRDAVFSAFQQHFQVNAGMAHFLDMKSSAIFYDGVMTIGDLTRRSAKLDLFEIRYEELVADVESQMRRLLEFIGLPWNDAVLDYQSTAKNRLVRTASAKQVLEKPYADSIGKWRRYREGMASALPILAPWVEKFGYDPD